MENCRPGGEGFLHFHENRWQFGPLMDGQASTACPTMLEYRRRLPHFQPDHVYIFLTWRLFGSLPAIRAKGSYPTPGHAFVAADRALDRPGSGSQWLRDPRIAGLVAESIRNGESRRRWYELDAWVVMPNHVHLLILPQVSVPAITRWLKSWTARQANQLLGLAGRPFWQDESYDHWVRNRQQRDRIVRYIEQNPVSAGLAASAEQWGWSSAGGQAAPPAPPPKHSGTPDSSEKM
jgi:REP element-mobilizing transposase RayT